MTLLHDLVIFSTPIRQLITVDDPWRGRQIQCLINRTDRLIFQQIFLVCLRMLVVDRDCFSLFIWMKTYTLGIIGFL